MRRSIKKLSAILRKKRDAGLGWKRICTEESIIDEKGRPSSGLAYLIAYKDFEPTEHATRDRLRLTSICPNCKRLSKRHSRVKSAHLDQPAFLVKWKHLPTEERQKVIKSYLKFKGVIQ